MNATANGGHCTQRNRRPSLRASESADTPEQAAPPAAGEPSQAMDPTNATHSSSLAATDEPAPPPPRAPAPAPALPPAPAPALPPALAQAPAPSATDMDASVDHNREPHQVTLDESDEEPVVETPDPNPLGSNGSLSTEESPVWVPAPVQVAAASRVPRKRIIIPLGLPAPDGYELIHGRGYVRPRGPNLIHQAPPDCNNS